MKLISPAFQAKEMIPHKYTCQGQNINPPLKISDIPPDAKSLAIIMEDPDSPGGTFTHWIQYNIPVIDIIPENSSPGQSGLNDFREQGYGGPCPAKGIHRYFIRLYALDDKLALQAGADRPALSGRMKGHILGQAELMGIYRKQ